MSLDESALARASPATNECADDRRGCRARNFSYVALNRRRLFLKPSYLIVVGVIVKTTLPLACGPVRLIPIRVGWVLP